MNIVWQPEAAGAFEATLKFIEERAGRESAAAFGSRVARVVEQAAQFPALGRVVPEFAVPRVRERLIDSYRLMYCVVADGIEILAFVHGSRDMPDR